MLLRQFGYCGQVQNYFPSVDDLHLAAEGNLTSDVLVFLTSKTKQSTIGLDFTSQQGDKIKFLAGGLYSLSYNIDIESHDDSRATENSNCNAEEDYSYSDCVDDKIQNDYVPLIGCVPPYLSNKNHCGTVNIMDKEAQLKHLITDYQQGFYYFTENKAQSKCKIPCQYQIIKVKENIRTSSGDY